MQSQSLTAQQPQALTAHQYQKDQIELIKKTYAKGATDTELALFVEVAQRKGLDIFSRQIHLIKRKNRKTGEDEISIQTGIDGYRLLAERTGKYEGQVGPFWCDEKGEWKDVWLSSKPPAAAKVGILKSGCKEPFYAVALFREYAQTDYNGNPIALWARMPANQLSKCSEALALRKAFPSEMSGIYTQEEMAQAENAIDIEVEVVEQKPATKTPRAALKAVPKAAPVIEAAAEPVIERPTVIEKPFTQAEADEETAMVQALQDDPLPEFAAVESVETPEEIETDKHDIIGKLKALTLRFKPLEYWEEWVATNDPYSQTRGWLQTKLELSEAKASKLVEVSQPVAIENPHDAPAQLPDGRRKVQRVGPDGKEGKGAENIAVYAHPAASASQHLAALEQWIEHWRKTRDVATIRAKVESVIGKFENWAALNSADMAKAIRVLEQWKPELDKQTAQKGVKK